MVDVAVPRSTREYLRTVEFYTFCVISFAAKSILLIGLPYREWPVNTLYTSVLLLFFYFYFRFRQKLVAPPLVILCLGGAVAVDVLGNHFGFYGHPFGPLRDYDEFAHFTGSGLSAIAAFWLLRAGTRQMGFKVSAGVLGLLSTTVAFAYCGWYEILELWDEYFWSGFERIHTWDDTANDLFYDFIGVIAFIALATLVLKAVDRRSQSELKEVQTSNVLGRLPKGLAIFLITAAAFGACAWFEILRMWDQKLFGRIHLIGNRDTAINLEWELAASIVVSFVWVGGHKLRHRRAPNTL